MIFYLTNIILKYAQTSKLHTDFNDKKSNLNYYYLAENNNTEPVHKVIKYYKNHPLDQFINKTHV